MHKAVWATYYHVTSTDEDHHHDLCDIKWCFYKQAIAKGFYIYERNLALPQINSQIDIYKMCFYKLMINKY